MTAPRPIRDVLSDYFNLCQLTDTDQQQLVGLAEAILAHSANRWPDHTYEEGDLDL